MDQGKPASGPEFITAEEATTQAKRAAAQAALVGAVGLKIGLKVLALPLGHPKKKSGTKLVERFKRTAERLKEKAEFYRSLA